MESPSPSSPLSLWQQRRGSATSAYDSTVSSNAGNLSASPGSPGAPQPQHSPFFLATSSVGGKGGTVHGSLGSAQRPTDHAPLSGGQADDGGRAVDAPVLAPYNATRGGAATPAESLSPGSPRRVPLCMPTHHHFHHLLHHHYHHLHHRRYSSGQFPHGAVSASSTARQYPCGGTASPLSPTGPGSPAPCTAPAACDGEASVLRRRSSTEGETDDTSSAFPDSGSHPQPYARAAPHFANPTGFSSAASLGSPTRPLTPLLPTGPRPHQPNGTAQPPPRTQRGEHPSTRAPPPAPPCPEPLVSAQRGRPPPPSTPIPLQPASFPGLTSDSDRADADRLLRRLVEQLRARPEVLDPFFSGNHRTRQAQRVSPHKYLAYRTAVRSLTLDGNGNPKRPILDFFALSELHRRTPEQNARELGSNEAMVAHALISGGLLPALRHHRQRVAFACTPAGERFLCQTFRTAHCPDGEGCFESYCWFWHRVVRKGRGGDRAAREASDHCFTVAEASKFHSYIDVLGRMVKWWVYT